MKRQIKKIICFTFAILYILLSPISSYLQLDFNAYAVTTFEQDLNSELFKQTLIPVLISSGIVFSNKESAEKVAADTIDWLKQQGLNFQDPNDPEGPKLGEVIKKMLKASAVVITADQLYKNIIEIPDLFWQLIKSFVDMNFDEDNNIIGEEEIFLQDNFNYDLDVTYNGSYKLFTSKYTIELIYELGSYSNYFPKIIVNDTVITGNGSMHSLHPTNFPRSTAKLNLNGTSLQLITKSYYGDTLISSFNLSGILLQNNQPKEIISIFGTSGIVDNPNYDWSNVHTQEREIVIPIAPDELGNNPKRDENGIMVPGIGIDEWIGVTPTEIPNMDPSGEPIEITEPGQLPSVPENPQTIPEKILYTLAETFKKITGIKENLDLENPTIMGVPSTDGTGNGGTGTPTKFEWGDFGKFFDIFFIFIYFIVILILILLKFLQVVFSNLPNIPANPELFNNYPTILEGVNFIKNLKVGGLSITVQQAFEYVFLIFFFIFILKQIRKLYGAYVYEENERSKLESGISGANYERRYSRTNYSSIIDKGHNSNYTGYSKGNIFDDAISNPDDYENINNTDHTRY